MTVCCNNGFVHTLYSVHIYNRVHPPKTISDMKQVELNADD